uniref:Uncharacterized protein n=1 Tax=Avena sativa TaxID=4498 RepID=A0ACD5YDX9_AVESA
MIEIVRNYHLVYKCTEDILSVIKPTEVDKNKRLGAIKEIVNSIRSVDALKDAAVKPFGSFVSNLYAKSGDLDVSVELSNGSSLCITNKRKNNALKELRKALQIKGVSRDVQFTPTARVPVLKYVSNCFDISCDVSINNYTGRTKSRVLYWLNTLDGRFGDMVLLVKEWAKAQNINDPRNGTLNSYSLCLLVIFHFQTCKPAIFPPMKEIYDVNNAEGSGGFNEERLDKICMENIAKFRRRETGQRYQNCQPLSSLLAKFFDKFCDIDTGAHYDTYTSQLKQTQDGLYRTIQSSSLFVEDPFERCDDAARTVDVPGLFCIASAFKHARDVIYSSKPADRDGLVSLLCTPEVGSKLGGRGIHEWFTYPEMSLPRSGPIRGPQRYNSGRQAAAPY